MAMVPTLAAGKYLVRARAGTEWLAAQTVNVVSGGSPLDIQFVSNSTSSLIVYVLDGRGIPIPGYIRVSKLESGKPRLERYSDIDGRALFHVSEGKWLVGLNSVEVVPNRGPRFLDSATTVDVRGGDVHHLTLRVPLK
jgi:hypothetical protein